MKESKEETRKERFRRVATRRTNKILEQIRVLGNCSNRSAYAYSDEEFEIGARALSAPIRDYSGKVIAGIGGEEELAEVL